MDTTQFPKRHHVPVHHRNLGLEIFTVVIYTLVGGALAYILGILGPLLVGAASLDGLLCFAAGTILGLLLGINHVAGRHRIYQQYGIYKED